MNLCQKGVLIQLAEIDQNLGTPEGLGFGAEVRCTSCKTWEAPKLLHLGIRGKCCTPTLSGLLGLGVASFVADHRDGLDFHQ